MKPILYSYYRSSCSYRVRIALYLKNIDFEYRPIHLVKEGGEQNKANYKDLNPRGEVPYLIDGDSRLSQSMAILLYLDKKHPDPALFPKEKAKCIELCEMINTGIQPIQNLKVLQYIAKEFGADDAAKAKWCKHWITQGFEALEKALSKVSGKYSIGDALTAADLFLIPQVYNAHRFKVAMKSFPLIQSIHQNCIELEAFKRAEPSTQPDAPSK